jgi:hypothetical protein
LIDGFRLRSIILRTIKDSRSAPGIILCRAPLAPVASGDVWGLSS